MTLKEKLYPVISGSKVGRAALAARHSLQSENPSAQSLSNKYDFVDRSKKNKKLCIVLAGYKEPLWDEIFGRLAAFVPEDVDVCILTSGLTSEYLARIAERNSWSYLSTQSNHLSLIQNIAIDVHPHAQWIYKIDEDIFITRNFFETLLNTYQYAEEHTPYVPAFVSPLINVSCFGYLRLLDKCNLTDDFKATGLTNMKLTDGLNHSHAVLRDPKVARYMWGETQPILRNIDALSEHFSQEKLAFTVCPIRYSIGAILFTRETWERFGKFPLTFVGGPYGLGDDEECICHYACFTGRAMIVSDNCLVGHLGYGGAQTASMLEYYAEHKARFAFVDDSE